MGIDTYVELSSTVTNQLSLTSDFGEPMILESEMGDKTVSIDSSVYADEVTELLRYEEIKPISKTVGAKYQTIKPPKQRV